MSGKLTLSFETAHLTQGNSKLNDLKKVNLKDSWQTEETNIQIY